MDPATPKPRVNGSMIPKCIGQYVCVVGRNLGVGQGGMTIQLETSDKQKLTAKFTHPVQEALSPYVELVGKVEYDCSLMAERVVSFGANFDLEAYNEVLQQMNHFPKCFPTS